MHIRTRTAVSLAALALMAGVTGTPAIASPTELRPPAQFACIHLPAALSGIETKGLFKVESETRLERGPYIAEHDDAEGTYFRAPPGGVYLGPPKDKPSNGAWKVNRDGGIFVPRDAAAPPQLYSYVGEVGTSVATVVPPAAADCSNTRLVRDPATGAIAVAGYAGEGMTQADAKVVGIGGGPGVLGYVIGTFVESGNMGKIAKLPLSKNPEFNARLGELARTAVPIKVADGPN
jgi:hypothetical protein